MQAPPRLALLAALGLVAIFPNLPLGESFAAGDQEPGELFALEIEPYFPASRPGMELDIAIVQPGAPWTGPLARYRPEQPLLLTRVHASCDVLLRSHDGLWAARAILDEHPSNEPLPMKLEPRGILSGVVLDSDNSPMHCLIQAHAQDGTLFPGAPSDDGTFRFPWLQEGKYRLISPLSVHGRCETDVISIAGQEIHIELKPQPTEGPPAEIIGHVQSQSGEYRGALRVRLWPMDANAAPTDADVVWNETTDQGVSGSFTISATRGEQYFMRVEKNDLFPAAYSRTPITAPARDVQIFCDDAAPHTELVVSPLHEGEVEVVQEFEVAVSWGDEVIWRSGRGGECRFEGVPTGLPVSWMVRSSETAPAYGESIFAGADSRTTLTPQLTSGWGEGLRLILPDGAPAANVLVQLDGQPAGRTDIDGLLTLRRAQRPSHLSLHADHIRLFGGTSTSRSLSSLTDRDEFGRLLLVLLPRD